MSLTKRFGTNTCPVSLLHITEPYCFICQIWIYCNSVLGQHKLIFSSFFMFFQIYSKKSTPASHSGFAVRPPCSGSSGHQLWSSPGQSWSGSHPVSAQFCQDARLGHQWAHTLQQDWWQTGVKYQRWEYFSTFIFCCLFLKKTIFCILCGQAKQCTLRFFSFSLWLHRPSRHPSGPNH